MSVTLFTRHSRVLTHNVQYVHWAAFYYHLEYLQSDGVTIVGGIWE